MSLQQATANGGLSIRDQLEMQIKEPEYAPTPATFEWPEKFTPAQRAIIGEGVREARKKIKMTQNQLEKLCGFEMGYISFIENGKVAKMEKPLLKKIGLHLKNDFNQLVMEACDVFVPAPGKKEVIIARGPRLEKQEEHSIRLKGPSFELKLKLSEKEFSLYQVENGIGEALVYSGNRLKDSLFLQALEEVVRVVKKGAE